MLTVIETPLFEKQWPLYWTEDERGRFAAYVAEYPRAGDVIPDSGGLRKISLGTSGIPLPFSLETSAVEPLGLRWPQGVVSLSHVALSFPPDDPLYGATRSENEDLVFLGDLAIRGERGLIGIPADWLLRQRYNPFYSYLEA
jgi:hypothetical protein